MSLPERDARLSRLLGQVWPHEPLLRAVSVTRNLDVLEVGAGEGKLLHVLKRRGHTGALVGLDPHPGEGIQQGTAENLPFPDASFDMVFMVRMLTHCTDPVRAITEAGRVLRPSGQLVVAVQGKDHLGALWQLAGREIPKRGPEDDVQNILRSAELRSTRQDIRAGVQLDHTSAAALLATYGVPLNRTSVIPCLPDSLHFVVFRMSKCHEVCLE